MFVFDGGDLQSRNYLRLFKQDDRQQAILHLQSRNYLRLFKHSIGYIKPFESTK